MAILSEASIASGSAAAGEALPPLMEVRALSKSFGATQALRDVSACFRRGEVHCLLGENGAGKSTLGKIIAGLIQPDTGRLLFDSQEIGFRDIAAARRHGVAIVFQELSLASDLTVMENICLGTEARMFPFQFARRPQERAACRRLMAELGLDIDPSAIVGYLSTADKQLVEIAKALYQDPELIVLDEPTAMLGAVEKQKLFAIVARLKAQGKAFIFITHHIEEVIELGDIVSIMKDGVLLETFAISEAVTADLIVEKLAGRKIAAAQQLRHKPRGDDVVLRIAGLPALGDGAMELVARRGEIVGLYGVVGCGREAIARALVGLDEVGGVEISLDGKRFSPRSPAEAVKAGIAYLPAGRADNGILPTLSIRENLTLMQLRRFLRGGVVASRAEHAAASEQLAWLRVKFGDKEDTILALSGGNQQKVLVGRVISMARKLLVLEDPTAGIDVAAKHDIHQLLRRRAETGGLAVILLSSDLLETLFICDSLYTVFKGRLVRGYHSIEESIYQQVIADVLGSETNKRMLA